MSHVSAARSWVLDTFPELKEYAWAVPSLPDLRLFESSEAKASLRPWNPWNALMEDLNTMVNQANNTNSTKLSDLDFYQTIISVHSRDRYYADLSINKEKKEVHRYWCATYPVLSSLLAIYHSQLYILAIAIHADHPNLKRIVQERKNVMATKNESLSVNALLIDVADRLETLDLLYSDVQITMEIISKQTTIDLNRSPVLVQWLWDRQLWDREKLRPYVISNDLADCYDTTHLTQSRFQFLIKNAAHRILEKTIPLFKERAMDRSEKYPNEPYYFLYKQWMEFLRELPQVRKQFQPKADQRLRIKELVRKQEKTMELLFDQYPDLFRSKLEDEIEFRNIIHYVIGANQLRLLRKISLIVDLQTRSWLWQSRFDASVQCLITATHHALYTNSIDAFDFLQPSTRIDKDALLITAARLRIDGPYRIEKAIEYLLNHYQYDQQTILKAAYIAANDQNIVRALLGTLGVNDK